jgi:hypothetical protein
MVYEAFPIGANRGIPVKLAGENAIRYALGNKTIEVRISYDTKREICPFVIQVHFHFHGFFSDFHSKKVH